MENYKSLYARKILNQRTDGKQPIIKKEYLGILKEIMDLYETNDLRWERAIEELRAFVLINRR